MVSLLSQPPGRADPSGHGSRASAIAGHGHSPRPPRGAGGNFEVMVVDSEPLLWAVRMTTIEALWVVALVLWTVESAWNIADRLRKRGK